jgi:hypothetical protein
MAIVWRVDDRRSDCGEPTCANMAKHTGLSDLAGYGMFCMCLYRYNG